MNIDNDEHEHVLICPDCDKTPEELGYAQRQTLRDEVMGAIKSSRYSCYKDEQCWGNLTDDRQRGILEHEQEILAAISTIFEGKQPLKGEGDE